MLLHFLFCLFLFDTLTLGLKINTNISDVMVYERRTNDCHRSLIVDIRVCVNEFVYFRRLITLKKSNSWSAQRNEITKTTTQRANIF